MGAPDPLLQLDSFSVASAPSLDWTLEVVGRDEPPPKTDELLISFASTAP